MCVGAGRMCTMPKAFPKEFREDVIRVYRDSDASMAQVAKDFGISPSCLKRWLAIDERKSSRSSDSSQSGSESSTCDAHDWVPGEVHLRKTGAAVTYRC